MSTNRSLVERMFAAFLSLVLVLGMFPVGVLRTSAEGTDALYGSVEAYTQNLTVSGNGTEKIEITNGDLTLNWIKKDTSVGRHQDGWWVGIKLMAPAGMTAEQLKTATYGYTADTMTKNFWDNKDSASDAQNHYIQLWGLTNETYLKEGKVTYNWYVNWDGTNVQHVQLKLDPNKVVLKDAQGNGVYPVYGTATPISQGITVTGNGTEAVSLTNSDITLQWVKADTSVGRYQDGWWIGLKVNAPAGMTAEQLKTATYGYTADTMTKSFWDNKDTADNAQNHHIQLWGLTDETYLKEGKVTYNWYFNWDGTNVQHVQLKLDPNKVVLKDAQGNGVYPVYGTVTPISQGITVTGNGTEAVSLTNSDITLQWVKADTSVGRNQDGWWIGLKVNAPAGMTAEQLKTATYGYTADTMTKNFWDNKDTADNAQSHHIQLWGLTNETYLKEGKVTYNWYFNWDGTNVQHVQLKLDPSKVKLEENADVGYGTVAAITPASTVISGTSHITAVVEEAELTYVEGNDKGRTAGWWVGIKATAPEGFSKNAQYAYVTNGVIGEAKSFETYKDGNDYIELWLKVTDESLEKELNDSNADKKLTLNYAFDWNGNGIYEQTIEFYVKADGNILLKNAAGQQVYPYFHGEVTTDIGTAVINETNPAEVIVDLNGYEILWDEGWQVSVKASLAGCEDVTITQTFQSVEETEANTTQQIDWNGDGLADQTVVLMGKVKLLKAEQVKPVLENASVGIDSSVLLAQGGSNAVTNADKAVGAVSYTIAENDFLTIDEKTGKVTVADGKWISLLKELAEKESFTVEVTASFVETGTHNLSSATYLLTIDPKNDDSLAFAQTEVSSIYGGQDGKPYTYKQEPVSQNGDIDTITYESSDETVATVADDGTVTFVKEGNATITATVTYKAGYTVTTASYNLSISKGEQAPLTFTNSDLEITYNDNGNMYTSAAIGGTTGNVVVYEIISGEGVARIADSSKPELTILTSGTVTVKATMPGNDGYNEVSATYTLTIKKAEQKIQLAADAEAVKNSEKEYTVAVVPASGWYSLNEQFNFVITEADDTAADTKVDPVSGVVTIAEGDYGTVKILVTRPGDNCFLDWPGQTFTLTIEQIDADSKNFKFEGAKHKNAADSSWYCGPVTITYAADGVKYQVSEEKQKNDQWIDSYTISEDGEYEPVLSVKSTQEHGGIHYALEVGTVKIDQTDPESVITYGETVWGKVFETLTFGFYQNETTVVINANDGEGAVSGVDAIQYRLADDPAYFAVSGKKNFTEVKGNTAVVTIPDQYIGKVEYYAVDKAGNEEAIHTSVPTIVVDSTKGTWTVQYAYEKGDAKGEAEYTDSDGVKYTRFDTTVTLTMNEKFFGLSLDELQLSENGEVAFGAPVISGYDRCGEWTKVAGENDDWTIELTLTSEGEHPLSMEYTNRSNKASDKYSQMVIIDRTPPSCEIEWSDTEYVEAGETNTRYYKDTTATATITITDAYFNPENTFVTDHMELMDGKKQDDVKTVTWNPVEGSDDKWTTTVELSEQGTHKLTVDTTDWAGNVMETKTTDMVVLDYAAPVCEITLDDADNTVGNIRYYKDSENDPVTVKIAICDASFDPTQTFVKDKIVLNDGTENEKIYDEDLAWKPSEGNSFLWIAEFTLTEEADHYLTVTSTDKVEHEMDPAVPDVVTIDNQKPEITVDPKHPGTPEEMYYGKADQENDVVVTVNVIIKEHNFDPDNVELNVRAEKVNGTIDVDYAAYAKNPSSWSKCKEQDTYLMTLTFKTDAKYSFDVAYTDLAENEAKPVENQAFTLDNTAPEELSMDYGAGNVWQNILNTIFFNQKELSIVIRAKDLTAGVDSFSYTYVVREVDDHPGISAVNKGLEKEEYKNVTATHIGGNIYEAKVTIPAQFDGYFSFTATDKSENVSAECYAMAGENGTEKQVFVVDTIDPKTTVAYSAPVQQIDGVSYYDDNIVATITVNDANFRTEYIADYVEVKVTRNGADYPVHVTWTDTSADIHTGVFGLAQDGDYIVNITGADPSGNEMAEYTSNQLTLDTTLPTVEVTNVVANSANTDEVYTFDITASDINIDVESFKPVLTGVFRNEDGRFEKRTIDMGAVKVVKKNETYTFTVENLEEDAIYTLTCSVKDLAGNTYEKMVLKDEMEYGEVQFSINRNGSTYMLDDRTMGLVDDYYVQNVDNDVVLIEINPDVLENHSVSLNGKELTEGDEYKVTDEGGNGSWMKYTYFVDKDLMADESEYMLVVSSEDKAGNKAFSDVKGASINFVVDRTAPVVTVTGMHNDGRYQVESQTVTLIPMDAGGALNTLSVYLVDDDGNVLEQLIDLSGEDLYNALEEGDDQITFEIGEGLYQNVRIVCTDMAVDADGDTNAYDETFTNISVSTSGFMIFWANKSLRYGVIFGLLGLIALIIFMIIGKKKKKA